MVTTKPGETQKLLRIDDRWRLSSTECLIFGGTTGNCGEALYWRIKGTLMGRGRRMHGLHRLLTNHEKAKP